MKLVSLEEHFQSFLERPTRDSFLRVRRAIVSDPLYRPQISTLVDLAQLVERRDSLRAIQLAESLMPVWALCPRVHYLAGLAAENLSARQLDEQALEDSFEEVELRRFLVSSCLEGILATGDGSPRHPFVATYPSDVRDVVTAVGLQLKTQRLVEGDDTLLDVAATAEGSTVCFDVGDLVAAGGADVLEVESACHGRLVRP